MDDKTVAWNEQELRNACRNARLTEEDFLKIKAYLPVYTSPRELSDEEIEELYYSIARLSGQGDFKYIQFARAILKKASEK
jgi:hypothetical protein